MNKAHAAKQLKLAVSAQQRALSALASATNAKIHQTNKHIAANAAQIKEKAKNRFDHKMANVTEQAKKGRSKLAAQAVAQDKRFRQYANNKIKEITANTASQFRKVRATMARDRATPIWRSSTPRPVWTPPSTPTRPSRTVVSPRLFPTSLPRRRRLTPVCPSSVVTSRCPSSSSLVWCTSRLPSSTTV